MKAEGKLHCTNTYRSAMLIFSHFCSISSCHHTTLYVLQVVFWWKSWLLRRKLFIFSFKLRNISLGLDCNQWAIVWKGCKVNTKQLSVIVNHIRDGPGQGYDKKYVRGCWCSQTIAKSLVCCSTQDFNKRFVKNDSLNSASGLYRFQK